jgi:hypothetical protein
VCEDDDFCWLPIEHAAAYTDLLIDDWLGRNHLTCCDFKGGFLINLDGQRWNENAIDEFMFTMTWLAAIEKLLNGETQASVSPYEHGELLLLRDGDNLTMFEPQVYIRRKLPKFCPLVTVSFAAFTCQIAAHSQRLAAWISKIHAEIQPRNPPIMNTHIPIATIPEEKLVKITHEIPLRYAEQAEAFAARVERELRSEPQVEDMSS